MQAAAQPMAAAQKQDSRRDQRSNKVNKEALEKENNRRNENSDLNKGKYDDYQALEVNVKYNHETFSSPNMNTIMDTLLR